MRTTEERGGSVDKVNSFFQRIIFKEEILFHMGVQIYFDKEPDSTQKVRRMLFVKAINVRRKFSCEKDKLEFEKR